MTTSDLLEQLTLYGSYHHNKWNQLIHFVFVPAMIWSICVWLSYTGSLLPEAIWASELPWLPVLIQGAAKPNAALALIMVYSIYYMQMDAFAGTTWALTTGLTLWLSSTAVQMMVPRAWAWAILVEVVACSMQTLLGHHVMEKRMLSVVDGIFAALALAPLFVWFKTLFLLGYRPALYQELQKRVDEESTSRKLKTSQTHTASKEILDARGLLEHAKYLWTCLMFGQERVHITSSKLK